jgi:phosphate transport system protein
MKKLIDIPRMAEIVSRMLRDVLTAYINNDATMAAEISEVDDQIDQLHNQVLREVMTYMMEDPSNISQAISLLFVSRFMERLGDHVTNIAEWICYNANGRHVELNK